MSKIYNTFVTVGGLLITIGSIALAVYVSTTVLSLNGLASFGAIAIAAGFLLMAGANMIRNRLERNPA